MFKFKNKSLKAAILSLPLASFVALVSCGATPSEKTPSEKTPSEKTPNGTKFGFEQPNDGRLKFATPWTSGARKVAMEEIIKKWNSLPEVQDGNNKEFLPVDVQEFSGYYDGMAKDISLNVASKDRKRGINLAFNYSGLAATLNSYKMLLNFNSDPELKQKIQDTYQPNFLKSGNLIGGVNPDGIYLIPAVKSGKILGIDSPLLAYFVQEATTKGNTKATIKEEDKSFFDNLKKTDQNFIKEAWGEYSEVALSEGGLAGYEFSKSKLENYKDLFDLASRIKKSFPSTKNNDGLSSKGRWLVGMNDSSSHWFISSFQAGNSDWNNYIVELGPKGFIYNLTKPDTPAYKNGKKAFDLFENLQKDDVVIYEGNIPKGNERSEVSGIQKKHLLLFSLMSTTNYNDKYEAGNSDSKMNEDEFLLLPEPTKTEGSETKKSITSQGPSIMGMHSNTEEDKATFKFLKWFISQPTTFEYKNKSKETKTFSGTPNDFFAFMSNYLNPTKSNLSSDYKTNTKLPQNPMFELLVETFKKVANNGNEYVAFSEPGDANSQTFRKAVQTTFGTIGNKLKSNNNDTKKINFDTFLEELKISLKGIIK